jgi:hypothetical protein
MGHSGDEAAAASVDLLQGLSREPKLLERVGQKLDTVDFGGANGLSRRLAQRLDPSVREPVQAALMSLPAKQRDAATLLLLQAPRLIPALKRSGMGSQDLLSALHKGSDQALLGLRRLKSDEAGAAYVRGVNAHGERFVAFARKADEPGVTWFARHSEELTPRQLDEVLANPTKYLDNTGKPTAELRKLQKADGQIKADQPSPSRSKSNAGWLSASAWSAYGYSWWALGRDALGFAGENVVQAGLSALSVLSVLAFLGLILFRPLAVAMQWLGRNMIWLLSVTVRGLGFVPALRGWAQERLTKLREAKNQRQRKQELSYRVRKTHIATADGASPADVLSLGIVGVNRVGKST